MKRLLMLIVAGLFLMAGTTAYAANATDTIGATINGSPVCTLAITSDDLTVTAPTEIGPTSKAFTNSPILMDIVDNTVTTVSPGTDILKVKISSSVPDQYGTTGEGKNYYIELGNPTFTADADSELTAGEVSADAVIALRDGDEVAMEFGTASGKILTGEFSQPASIKVNTDKRVYGNTSESVTITYTLVDN